MSLAVVAECDVAESLSLSILVWMAFASVLLYIATGGQV